MSLSHYLDPEFDEELNADDYEIEAEVAAFLDDAELGSNFESPASLADPSKTSHRVDLEASHPDIEVSLHGDSPYELQPSSSVKPNSTQHGS